MERHLTWTVDKSQEGKRLIDWLREKGCSKQVLSVIKNHEGSLLNNGEKPYFRDPLQAGDVVELTLPQEHDTSTIVPVRQEFSIIYEDEDLMVINKPGNLPVHPSINHFENTLANGVSWLCRQRKDYFPFRCVNRLDGGTTGLLILAKNVYSSAILYEQMKERKIHRTYLAIVSGKLTESGTIDLPIGRKSESVIERCVDKTHGERAVTHYEVLEARTDQTLVKCQLETGRTHQIRVHMQAIGHPLVGDFLYNPHALREERPLLHSWRLAFTHPVSEDEVYFTAPVPADMQGWKWFQPDKMKVT